MSREGKVRLERVDVAHDTGFGLVIPIDVAGAGADRERESDPGWESSGVELLERLAALTPRPRINLLLYYGVLSARSAWRSRL